MDDMEPVYAFSIPSVADDLALSCRIYHPRQLEVHRARGAIIAHPYAPLGGCFDDAVVLAATETLLHEGYIVGTFNFRGAGDSEGRTSWTGKAEQDDYASFAGFIIYYLLTFITSDETDKLETIPSATNFNDRLSSTSAQEASTGTPLHLLLGGYSYGSLVLARLPPVSTIVQRFEDAQKGTAAAEIILRARTLAKQTLSSLQEVQTPTSPRRGRQLDPNDAESPQSPQRRIGVSPITVGGEETDPSMRRRSRDTRRSGDIVRKSLDAPHRIKAHIRGTNSPTKRNSEADGMPDKITSAIPTGAHRPVVIARYLVLSPFLLPFTNTLSPPGPPSVFSNSRKHSDSNTHPGSSFVNHKTIAIFGSADVLTASRRLRAWAEKMAAESESRFEWAQIEGAGHFWHEPGAMRALQERIKVWVQSSIG